MKKNVRGQQACARTIVLAGAFNTFCVPDVLYHGTWGEVAELMLNSGMQHQAGKPQSLASAGANYLTTSLSMAASIARSRAHRHGDLPRVIAVDASQLNPDYIAFDMSMCGKFWSESIAYGLMIPPQALSLPVVDATTVPEELMLLDEPTPGERPLAFNLDWPRAQEFLSAALPVPQPVTQA